MEEMKNIVLFFTLIFVLPFGLALLFEKGLAFSNKISNYKKENGPIGIKKRLERKKFFIDEEA